MKEPGTERLLRELITLAGVQLAESKKQTAILTHIAADVHSLWGQADDKPTSIDFRWLNQKNRRIHMAVEDGNVVVGQTEIAVPVEFNAENQAVTIVPANIQWATDDPNVATISTDPDTGNGVAVGVAAGVTGVTVTDSAQNLTKSGTLTVTFDGKAVSIDFSWQEPKA